MKQNFLLFIGVVALAVGIVGYRRSPERPSAPHTSNLARVESPVAPSSKPLTPSPSIAPPLLAPRLTPAALPSATNSTVPFLVQAPLANWDATHEEACEEASLLMVVHYLQHRPIASPADAEKEILALIQDETDHGYKKDVTVGQLSQIARDYFGLTNGRVKTDVSVFALKQELAAGHPIIVPAAGRLLNNPHFRSPGPIYHMLVLRGYDSTGFLVNDPGTRVGENYHYPYPVLVNAIHDWNAQDIMQGAKTYLVFE